MNFQPIRTVCLLALLALLGSAQRSFAVIDSVVTKNIWAMKYGVTNTQITETAPDTNWLSKDDDGDGMTNEAEMAAGTNPFNPGSVAQITTIADASGGTAVAVTFTTEKGKFYVVQGTPSLSTSFTSTASTWLATGGPKTLTVSKGANKFFRMLVQDTDSDGDGAADWAETVAGYAPNNAADGGAAVMNAAIASSNVVTVSVTRASATQPLTGFSAVETGSITVSRGGPLKFQSLTVPLQITGSAVQGTDYQIPNSDLGNPPVPSSVTFPVGVSEVVLTVTPLANSSRKTNVVATVKALAGSTYILGGAVSGSVVINPAGVANGTGLTGQYHNASSSNYATQTGIFNGAAELTRTDATVDFNGIASIATGNPCTVTMKAAHGLTTGTPVAISSVTGGTFSPTINGIFVATVTGPTTFTVASNCTVAPTSLLTASVCGVNSITSVSTAGTSPTTITTKVPHGMTGSPSVAINWLNGGTFGSSINATFTATVTGASTFTIPITCSASPSAAQLALATVSGPAGVNGWGSTSGPVGMSSPATGGAWSARWTGQVLPQYSETYTFDLRSSQSAKVWVNGQLLVDRWTAQTTTQEFTNTIALKAGTLYDIQIDYFMSAPSAGASGNAEARLYWWSPSQTKQIIPSTRLFPAPAQNSKPTTITSSLAATGYVSTPFSFNVTSAVIGGSGTTYALTSDSGPLPPGLSLNSTTGVITGNPTTAGTYNVAINSVNVAANAVMGSSIVDFTIFPVGGVTRETLVGSTVVANGTIATFDDDTDYPDNTSRRLRGYMILPKTGNYYFWLAASNSAELWISTDEEYVNRVRYATVSGGTAKKTWNTTSSQQSPWLALVGGQKYYIEVLQNTGTDADDHVSVGWCQDDIGTVPAVPGAPNATGAPTVLPNGGGPLQGYPLSGTAPGYLFQPYDYPAVTPSTGTLYACNLGPQTSATTQASGSANIQVNAAETQAILHFKYQNLGTPKTAYHLHVDGFVGDDLVTHPQGEIIYDIDDADQNPSEQTADGGYIWNFAPVGSFSSATQLREALHKGKVYLNIHSVTYPDGEIRGTFGLIDGSQTPPDAATYPEPTPTDVASTASGAPAARFLNQASFGASPADVTYVKSNGFQGWITDQLTKPASHNSNEVVAGMTSNINDLFPSSLFTNAWWRTSVSAQDQLRQRLAFALSEIMVISWANDTGPLARNSRILADYYDQLIDYCLPPITASPPGTIVPGDDHGTFRGLLKAVTLTPAMGLYLDMRANQKGDDSVGRHPNENYGREIMQLFSVGIYRMWDDGRFVLGSDAGLVPTYSQPNILGLSALLTGWNYNQAPQANGRAPSNFGPGADYLNPMVLVPQQHELASKLLLNNAVSPAATGLTPRVVIGSVSTGTPCTINTNTVHGLKVGDTVIISGLSGGTFSAPINASHQVTQIVDADSFKVAIDCSGAPSVSSSSVVTGATVIAVSGGTAVTGSQADNAGTGANHPYDLYGLAELDRAIDNIVNNDNVPPYICRQLIQRLVTSDPSPGYVYRVVQKFKDDGTAQHVRGNLAAVVSQILLDGEARRTSAVQNSTGFGKQREPMLRLTGPARAFPATNYVGTYTQLTGVNSNKLRIVTTASNDFSSGFSVPLNFHDQNSNGQTSDDPYTNPTTTNYTIGSTTGIASIIVSNPAKITTTVDHGLTSGDVVTIVGVSGGSATLVNNLAFTVTVVDSTSFTVPVNFTTASTPNTGSIVGAKTLDVPATGIVNATYTQAAAGNLLTVNTGGPQTDVVVPGTAVTITGIAVGNPCVVTTSAAHNLVDGGRVAIAGISDGSFDTSITGNFTVSNVVGNTFTVPVNCTVAAVAATGTSTKLIRSKVYLAFLTQTTAGGAVIPVDGIFEVQSTTGTTSFTVTTLDTPVTGRGGNVLLPKFTTSYTPVTSNTQVRYNTNVNHNFNPVGGTHIWVDVPVVNNPVKDSEYVVQAAPVTPTSTVFMDEDHFMTTSQPFSTNGGTYSNPSGSNNGITVYPLEAPPLGRSGNVTIGQSTFTLGSTEGSLTQSPLNSPTVFNYFFPDYKFPGTLANTGLDSPEFQLTTDTNVMNLTNSITNMMIGTGGANSNLNGLSSFNNGTGLVVFDVGSYMTDSDTANAGIPGLIDKLSNLLVGAPLEASTKTTIQNFVANTTNFPMTGVGTPLQKRDRVRAIIHLIITSAEYAVQK